MLQTLVQSRRRFALPTGAVEAIVFLLATAVVVESAVLAKRLRPAPPLVALSGVSSPEPMTPPRNFLESEAVSPEIISAGDTEILPGEIRFFDGRPVRPVKTIWMTVTAYSPDARSCDESADGYTATNHSVWTNAMRLVAADTRLLPFGSLVSVPGYADGDVVPVMDRGGAIKGKRLDVLYPTHEVARKWGVRRVPVVVWEYADGKPVGKATTRYPKRR